MLNISRKRLFAGIIYFIASAFLAHRIEYPTMIIFVTSLSYVLIPVFIGRLALYLLLGKATIYPNDKFLSLGIELIVGKLIIYYSASLLSSIDLLDPVMYSYSIALLPPIALLFISFIGKEADTKQYSFTSQITFKTFSRKSILPILLLFFSGVFPIISSEPLQPFPLSHTGNIVGLRLSFEFINKGYVELVRGYFQGSMVDVAILSVIYGVHPLEVLSATKYLSHFIYPLLIFFLARKYLKNDYLAVVPALLSPWLFLNLNLFGLENTSLIFFLFALMLYLASSLPNDKIAYAVKRLTSISNIPFVFGLTVLPASVFIFGKGGKIIPPVWFYIFEIYVPLLLVSYVLSRKVLGYEKDLEIFVIFVFPLVMMMWLHPYFGALVSFASALLLLLLHKFARASRKISLLIIFENIYILSIIIFKVNFNGVVFTISRILFGGSISRLPSPTNQSVQSRWFDVLNFGPPEAMYLMIGAGLLAAVFLHRKFTPFAAIMGLILAMFLLPEGTMYYWFLIFNPLSMLCIIEVLYYLEKASVKFRIKRIRVNFRLSALAAVVVILIILPSAYSTRMAYIYNFAQNAGSGYYSYIQPYDIQASKVILNRSLSDRTVIISDPGTMFFLAGLTGMDTALAEYIYLYPQEYSNETWIRMDRLNQLLRSVESQQDFCGLLSSDILIDTPLWNRNFSKILIVVTPRTYYWLYENIKFPVGSIMPLNIAHSEIIQVLNKLISGKLLLVYSSEDLFIYEAKCINYRNIESYLTIR